VRAAPGIEDERERCCDRERVAIGVTGAGTDVDTGVGVDRSVSSTGVRN
jgi:hypothetical protein